MKREIKKIFGIISFSLFLLLVLLGLLYINHFAAEKTFITARIDIQEGTLIEEENFELYFSKKNLNIKNPDIPNLIEYNENNIKNIINKRTKYYRKNGDFLWKDYVEINMNTDYVKYKLSYLSEKYNKKYVAKSVKLNPDEYFQAKGIIKGEDKVKIKFIRDIEKEQILVERYEGIPILDWDIKKGSISNIVIAMPENEASMFDLERLNNKKMIVEFEPFLSENYVSNKQKVFWLKDINEEYKSGISYKVDSKNIINIRK